MSKSRQENLYIPDFLRNFAVQNQNYLKQRKDLEEMIDNEKMAGRRGGDSYEPLFSRTVKAGKRVYYLDVKQDRRNEYYIAMTESRRIQDGTLTERPVFEKHKIFLYREDIINFLSALTDAAQFVGERSDLTPHERHYVPETFNEQAAAANTYGVAGENDKMDLGSSFDIEFWPKHFANNKNIGNFAPDLQSRRAHFYAPLCDGELSN